MAPLLPALRCCWRSVLGALLLLAAVWCSTGYHGEDEHHQTIGLALTRAHAPTAEAPVWEFGARIRGSALPWIATGVWQLTAAIGITDPFVITGLLRLITALLAFVVLRHALRAIGPSLSPPIRSALERVTWTLWWMPFLCVRFAAETWSGLWLLAGIALLVAPAANARQLTWAGVCLAMAVWVRPPVAVAVAGVLAWWWTVRRPPRVALTQLILVAFAVLALSVLADSLFYRTPTCSIARYAALGITGHPDHEFGALPWWYYFPWVVKYAVPPVGLAILLAFGLLLWKDRRHPLVWAIVPFLILHMVVAHKEPRFLYPLAPLMPWLLVTGWRLWGTHGHPVWGRIVRAVLIASNIPALLVATFTPAGNGRVAVAAYLQEHGHARSPVAVIAPNEGWRIGVPRFYRPSAPAPVVTTATLPAGVDFAMSDRRTPQPPTGTAPLMQGQPQWAVPLLDLYFWGEWNGPAVLLRRVEAQ